ncbi:MAG: tetratricopeptide repeat protein [Candidatus Sungbacteria bacterium]|nr:tetratricopeptide repeat protein [bacterium]MDZ4260118.1 tetratricopeptide repeat protein [Candidatus Sungbacteria bacterium]
MEKSGEQFDFKAKETMSQRYFQDPAVQSFFDKWCQVNDSIEPVFIDRQEWEEREKILEENPDKEKMQLYMPSDLRLWEMVGVLEAVDHDTFAQQLEKREAKKEELMQLGKNFRDAGVYIAQRLSSVSEGKEIAQALAEEFYTYGDELIIGKKSEQEKNIEMIAHFSLSPEETEAVDRWLAGESLYISRHTRAEKAALNKQEVPEEFLEQERLKTLIQFFRVSAHALKIKSRSEKGELTRLSDFLPWEDPVTAPIHTAFLKKIESSITKQVETPKKELQSAIFRRGMELLQHNIGFDTLPDMLKNMILHWQHGEETLREALQIDHLKNELAQIRRTGRLKDMVKKEREIASIIQDAVSEFEYKESANNPSEIATTQILNCVGASTLGGALLSEVGIRYLVADVPRHSILILVTSDNSVFWHDMLNPGFNSKITDKMIVGKNLSKGPLTAADIARMSEDPSSESIMFDIDSDEYQRKLSGINEHQRQFIMVHAPEIGLQAQILNNTANIICALGEAEDEAGHSVEAKVYYDQAVIAYKEAISTVPKYTYAYDGLGLILLNLDRPEEAIEMFRKSIAIDSRDADVFSNLGAALNVFGKHQEAMEACIEAREINPTSAWAWFELGKSFYYLGKKEEAKEAHHKAIELARKKQEQDDMSEDWAGLIDDSEVNIRELEGEQ